MKRLLQNFFIPSVENGYKPNSLEKRAATIMLLLVITTFSLSNLQVLFTQSSSWFLASILPPILVDLTNTERNDVTLVTLTRSEVLDRAATLKANDMAEKEYFAHDSPDGHSPWYYFEQVGYKYAYAGENLAVNFSDSDEVVDAWMNSPGHRANIMKAEYREIGIGTAKGMYKGTPTVYVVQLFGTPLSRVTVAPPTNQQIAVTRSAEVPTNGGGGTVLAGSVPNETPITPPTDSEKVTDSDALSMRDRFLASIHEPTVPDTEVAYAKPEMPNTELAIATKNALFSDFATTSVKGAVQIAQMSGSSPAGYVARPLDFFARLVSSSHNVISFVYLLLSLFVALSLVCAVVIEWRRQHGMQVAYGVGLMATMMVMFYLHIAVTGGTLIV